MIDWISTCDRMPPFGKPVILRKVWGDELSGNADYVIGCRTKRKGHSDEEAFWAWTEMATRVNLADGIETNFDIMPSWAEGREEITHWAEINGPEGVSV